MSWNSLPLELIDHIATFVNPQKELCSLRLLSKRTDPTFARQFWKSNCFKLTDGEVESLLDFIDDSTVLPEFITQLSVCHITLVGIDEKMTFLKYILQRLPNIKKLDSFSFHADPIHLGILPDILINMQEIRFQTTPRSNSMDILYCMVHLTQLKTLIAFLDLGQCLPAEHKQPGFQSNVESLELYWRLHPYSYHPPSDSLYLISLTRQLKKLVLYEDPVLGPIPTIVDITTSLILSRQTLQTLEFRLKQPSKPIPPFDPQIFQPFTNLQRLKLTCVPMLHPTEGITPFLPRLESLEFLAPACLTKDDILLLIRSRPLMLRQLISNIELPYDIFNLILKDSSLGVTRFLAIGERSTFAKILFKGAIFSDE